MNNRDWSKEDTSLLLEDLRRRLQQRRERSETLGDELRPGEKVGFHRLAMKAREKFKGEQIASYNIYRAFELHGEVPPTEASIVGLVPYFRYLGLSDSEVDEAAELLHEARRRHAKLGRKIAARLVAQLPNSNDSYSTIVDTYGPTMARLQEHLESPATFVEAKNYLIGTSADDKAGVTDRKLWGLIQYEQEFCELLGRLNLYCVESSGHWSARSMDRLRASMRQLEAAISLWAIYLLFNTRFAEALLSNRRWMLWGNIDEQLLLVSRELGEEIGRITHQFSTSLRSAFLAFIGVDAPDSREFLGYEEKLTLKTLSQAFAFYSFVVQGSTGTSATFRAGYQLRRSHGQAPDSGGNWTGHHERLISQYDSVIKAVNSKVTANPDETKYSWIKEQFYEQFRRSRNDMIAVWTHDFLPQLGADFCFGLIRYLLKGGMAKKSSILFQSLVEAELDDPWPEVSRVLSLARVLGPVTRDQMTLDQ